MKSEWSGEAAKEYNEADFKVSAFVVDVVVVVDVVALIVVDIVFYIVVLVVALYDNMYTFQAESLGGGTNLLCLLLLSLLSL